MSKNYSRRSFLKLSAVATAFGATSALATDTIKGASEAELKEAFKGSKKIKTICTHCSVGCGVIAEVVNGVWVRQEVAQDHPISKGGHCCKGADLIDKVRGGNRLKYPIQKVAGKWKRTSWDDAMSTISKKILDLQKQYGPDSIMMLGSAKVSNEQSYYIRKFAAMMGTNNIDHQARI